MVQRLAGERERPLTSQLFFVSASGLWTASPPLLSLLTRYCGSSSDARTVRPAASVSLVIFFSTTPLGRPPWLCQVTLSPFSNLCHAGPYPVRVRSYPGRGAGS